jgi:hypothetical protein
MTLSKLIIGGIFTSVPVLSTPGLSNFSMPTLRRCRTMITDWYFSPLLVAISSQLIPRSSATSSECLFSSYLAVLIMRYSFLHLWTISESSSTLFPRERSAPPPSGSAPYLLLIVCWRRLLSTITGRPSGVVT